METFESNTQDPMENTFGDAGAPQDYELASPGARFGAYLIDGLVGTGIYVVAFILALIPKVGGIFLILGWLAFLVYHFTKDALPFLNGQSVGKKLLKLRVVDEDTMEPITGSYGKSIIRVLSLAIPIVNIIDIIFIFNADKRHQRMGDQWAKTIVIKEEA